VFDLGVFSLGVGVRPVFLHLGGHASERRDAILAFCCSLEIFNPSVCLGTYANGLTLLMHVAAQA